MLKKQIRSSILVLSFVLCIAAVSYSTTFETYYNQGKAFLKVKDYPKAYEAFLNAFQISPGNWEVDFYLGRSAFETEKYEMSIMAFERALITYPGRIQVKLEMARAYQKLGLNDMARKYCNEVLLTNPPDIVKENIEKFLADIDKTEQRHFLRSTIMVGLDWNDNAWASPINNIINTSIGEVILTGTSAQEKQEWITNTTAVLNHMYSFPYKEIYWSSTAAVSKAFHHEYNELNTLYLSIESGPQLFFKNSMFGISFLSDYIEIDDTQYQTSIGLNTSYKYQLSPNLLISPNVQIRKKMNQSNEDKDAKNVSFNVDTSYLMADTWLNLTLCAENEDAKNDEFSYQRYAVEFSFTSDLPWDITLYGNYNFASSTYEDIASLFTEARKDRVHNTGIGIRKRLWESQNRQKSISISLGYQYTYSDSNIDLYEYRKNQIQTLAEYRF